MQENHYPGKEDMSFHFGRASLAPLAQRRTGPSSSLASSPNSTTNRSDLTWWIVGRQRFLASSLAADGTMVRTPPTTSSNLTWPGQKPKGYLQQPSSLTSKRRSILCSGNHWSMTFRTPPAFKLLFAGLESPQSASPCCYYMPKMNVPQKAYQPISWLFSVTCWPPPSSRSKGLLAHVTLLVGHDQETQ